MTAVRREEAADGAGIAAVHLASFPTDGEARVVDALRAAGLLALSLVAVEGEQVVGHVAFSPVQLAGASGGVGLGPVAVLPDWRRRGLAARLIREGLLQCAESGCSFVVVLGAPQYYNRFAFTAASLRGLCDEWKGGDAFQVLELHPGSLPEGGGLVRYASEFGLLEG